VNRLKQFAILLDMTDKLRRRGSWCGETHLQKATYFLQELLRVPTEFSFVLYKHGPFSFDLRDVLTAMRADRLLDLQPKGPYGPSLVPTQQGIELKNLYPKTLHEYGTRIEFVADHLADKNASDLEKLATALFVTLENEGGSVEERAEEISDLKPHIDPESAEAAVIEVEAIIDAASQL
jgi:hypothetical protein